ncbi:MAG: PhzF family phenazine biosynthesis protein [Spirochaetales bacterium]|nr:PhzF family phenazine biosynthesis protein [Spirochaetales bacterium]MCF7938552.1 PhzF family phenazine biosynthesis protein [Spirochaetales bacterium]
MNNSQDQSLAGIPIWQVDAFACYEEEADRLLPFSGNPAAVIITESPLHPEDMQNIAAENNLSETAFLVPGSPIPTDDSNTARVHKPDTDTFALPAPDFSIRWFTPTTEVDLCGHATLASAHVLFNHRGWTGERIVLSSRSGLLTVRQRGKNLVLDFPSDPPEAIETPPDLSAGLGKQPVQVLRGKEDFLAVFEDQEEITRLDPDMDLISALPSRGIICTAPAAAQKNIPTEYPKNSETPAGPRTDFVSRYFAPQAGIPEDPVTGSAHTVLTPYWSRRLGKTELIARQLSRRGGMLICRERTDRTEISGLAITYLAGEIHW